MPLDEFQKSVIAVISCNRDSQSAFAGGSVIQQHGVRLTDDQDIFAVSDERLDGLAETDQSALEAAGYIVQPRRSFDGFRECLVMKPLVGTTTLQWTAGLASEFYAPVPDSLFGRRLHFADLAVNKALAAGSRIKKRDFLDLVMLDRYVMPLWRMACAVPGKRADLNPFSLVERISHNWDMAVRRTTPDDRLVLTAEVSLEEIGERLHSALNEARTTLPDAPPESYGRLEVKSDGQPVFSRKIASGGDWRAPRPGGALPAFEGIDNEMIARLIAEFGPEGSRYTAGTSENSDRPGKDFRSPFTTPDPARTARPKPDDDGPDYDM